MPIKQGDRLENGDTRNGDERFDPRSTKKGLPDDGVVAAECDANLAASWPEMYTHLQTQLKGSEEIGCVIVHIRKPDEKGGGRWIDYSAPRPGQDTSGHPHRITVNKCLKLEKAKDVHTQTITIINTGGPDTNYRHYAGCYWVCQ
jgi:hypothetical protein